MFRLGGGLRRNSKIICTQSESRNFALGHETVTLSLIPCSCQRSREHRNTSVTGYITATRRAITDPLSASPHSPMFSLRQKDVRGCSSCRTNLRQLVDRGLIPFKRHFTHYTANFFGSGGSHLTLGMRWHLWYQVR